MVDPTHKESIPEEWLHEFEVMARRPLKTQMRYAFIKTYKLALEDVEYRAFDTRAEYRKSGFVNLVRIPPVLCGVI